jgi:hypothetical protein
MSKGHGEIRARRERSARVATASVLLDRGWRKLKQSIEFEALFENRDVRDMTAEELAAIVRADLSDGELAALVRRQRAVKAACENAPESDMLH